MSREKSLFKNIVILSIGTIFPKMVSFFALPILTAQLSKQEYGTYDLITSAVMLFLPIVTLQIQTAAFRYLIECRKNFEKQKSIITNIIIFVMVLSGISLTVLFFVLHKIDIVTRLLICFYYMADIVLIVIRQIVRGLGKNKLYSSSVVVESFSYIGALIIILLLKSIGLESVLFAIMLSMVAGIIFLILKIKLYTLIDLKLLDKKVLLELLDYSWPMIPNSLSNWVIRLSDRWIITACLGVEANAIYAVATKLPTLYTRVQNIFTQAWQENASLASEDESTDDYYTKMFDTMYCIFFAMMSMLIAVTPVLFSILIKGDYDVAYYQLPILYIGAFFSSISAYLGGIYVAYKQTKKVGFTTLVAAIINLVVDLAIINFVGIYAGAISTLVSYMVLAIYRMYDVQKVQKLDFKIYKMIGMLCILIFMSLLSLKRDVVFLFFNIVIAIVVSIIYNYKFITMLLKSINLKYMKK